MSEQPEQNDMIAAALMGGLGQLRAMMTDATAPELFEYARVFWAEVNTFAREGWQLVPIAAHYIPGSEERLYVMVRKLGVADAAAELLKGE